MTDEYGFTKAFRGPVLTPATAKTRITIRIDDDILEWFRDEADNQGGANYRTMVNAALPQFVDSSRDPLEEVLRRVVRKELRRTG